MNDVSHIRLVYPHAERDGRTDLDPGEQMGTFRRSPASLAAHYWDLRCHEVALNPLLLLGLHPGVECGGFETVVPEGSSVAHGLLLQSHVYKSGTRVRPQEPEHLVVSVSWVGAIDRLDMKVETDMR